MTTFIETLNQWGDHCLKLAWPVLWQSSVLIAVIFVLEFALRRKIRAAIRYALWLVVLVKLLLPPSLALPTSPTWWMHPSVPPPTKAPPVSFTVTYGEQMAPSLPLPPPPVIPPPKAPAMSFAAWILTATGVVSAGLLAWLLVRWRQISQKARRATASEKLIPILDETRRLTHLRPGIRLKLTEDSMSPAVCGLFRPVILLPKSLVERLSDGQLRAVLLHEAIHLRRGDVWVNCAQALLQIVYWWHPLLWLANARIRRVREEAVDDAVMLALRDDAEIYAPTLLEVAKLAFNRPLASLGLVGILESRSALRQRIERLVNFNAPRKAGLTAVSILGILAFSAVALPMGKGPEKTNSEAISLNKSDLPTVATNAFESAQMVQDDKVLYEVGKLDDAEDKLTTALALNPTNQAARYYLDLIEQSRLLAPKTFIINPAEVVYQLYANSKTTNLDMRGFRVDAATLRTTLLGLPPIPSLSIPGSSAIGIHHENLSKKLGVDLTAPGRSVTFDFGAGLLFVRATPSEMETIERAVHAWNQVARQIHMKARFIEVPPAEVDRILLAGTAVETNRVEIIAADKMKSLLQQLESASGVKILAEPESVVTTGRQVQMRSINSTVDLVPRLLEDGYTLNLHVIVGNPKTLTALENKADIWDGQTLALVFPVSDGKSRLVVFITPTIVDPAGNRVHSDDELRLMQEKAKRAFPPQPTSILPDANSRATVHALEQRTGVESLAEPEPVAPAKQGTDRINRMFVPDKINIPTITTNANESGTLVQEGKLLYEMGKFDDAEAKLKAALARSPTNQAAHYYLDLVEQARQAPKAQETRINYPALNSSPTNSNTQATNLEMRVFKVDPLRFSNGAPPDTLGVEDLSKKLGVDLTAPGRSIALNDRMGLLMVKATPSELDTIERVVQTLNQVNPQIHIKARFIEVEQDNNAARGFDWYLGSFSNGPVVANGRGAPSLAVPISAANPSGSFPGNTTTSVIPALATNQQFTSGLRNTAPAPATVTGILTDPNFRVTLHALESRRRTTILAEPEVVTISGRQTQMRVTDIHTVLTNINPRALKPPGVSSNELFLTEQVECGPVFDVVPIVLSDGYTLNLTTTASVTEFLGYDKATNSVTVYIDGKKQTVPVPLPKIRTQKISTVVNLWDNQTVVLGGAVTSGVQTTKNKVPLLGDLPLLGGLFRSQTENPVKKQLMVFVTATIVDPAGNRVHSDDELPFKPNTVPPQPH